MVPINVPNILTVIRILLVPVLLVALLENTGSGDLLAAIVFVVASVTDAIDGYLARSRNWVTTFGKLMDPIADKLLIIAALVALVSLGRLEAWVAMVIIAREFAVTVLRVAVGTQQGTVISASALGKLKTAVQVAMVLALIAVDGRP
ncbi:MAG TPA: CDP-diacylglycerol--glycerol-3-phosphate 3-phosphatidyltransferase, partial [Solirubrobacteraceae bacterium]